jgi:hypothetical protein
MWQFSYRLDSMTRCRHNEYILIVVFKYEWQHKQKNSPSTMTSHKSNKEAAASSGKIAAASLFGIVNILL